MSTSLWLPAPKNSSTNATVKNIKESASPNQLQPFQPKKNSDGGNTIKRTYNLIQSKDRRAPSYQSRCNSAAVWKNSSAEERKRNNPLFVPRSTRDFDDGGAFPEIHVAQYPLHMGNPHLLKAAKKGHKQQSSNSNALVVSGVVASSSVINVEVDANGEVSYDAIVKQGTNSNKIVYTKHSDVKGGEADPDAIKLPTQQEEEETTQKTNTALLALMSEKNALSKPSGSAIVNANTSMNQEAKTKFIKYAPNENAPGYNPAAKQRVIQMVPAQIDPMMPPKHQHKKIPRGPAEDPVPVLHAPSAKLTKEEKASWNIPACISNWKNTKGYTIPLDKRLAADGRGLRETTVNPNFATLSESLYVAERQAREEVKMRAKVQKQLATSERERREADLRELANKARMERMNITNSSQGAQQESSSSGNRKNNDSSSERVRDINSDAGEEAERNGEDFEDVSASAQRDRLRIARKKEREREMRMKNMKGGGSSTSDSNGPDAKKQRLEDERDVSEKIALGIHTGSGAFAGQVDSRLYNQSSGLDSGFGAEDEYNTYSKPLFDRDAIAKNIYKPTSNASGAIDADEHYDQLVKTGTSKFKPDRGFSGADGGNISSEPRNAPVQFEKSK